MKGNRQKVLQAIFDIQNGEKTRYVNIREIREKSGISIQQCSNAIHEMVKAGLAVRARFNYYTLDGMALQYINTKTTKNGKTIIYVTTAGAIATSTI